MRVLPLILLTGSLFFACTATALAGGVRWSASLPDAMAQAEHQGKLLLIHFWSTGCAPCQRMESYVFTREDVADSIAADFIPVKVDAMQQRDIAKQFGVDQWPTDVVATPSGKMIGKLVGERQALEYKSKVAELAAKYRYLYQPQIAGGSTDPSAAENPYRQAQYTAPGADGYIGQPAQQWNSNTLPPRGGGRWGDQGFNQQGGVNGGPYGQQMQAYNQQFGGQNSAPSSAAPPSGQGPFNPQQYAPAQPAPPAYGQQPNGQQAYNPQGPAVGAGAFGGPPQSAPVGDRWGGGANAPPNTASRPGGYTPQNSQVIDNPYGADPNQPSVAQRSPQSNPYGASPGGPSQGGPAGPPSQTPPSQGPVGQSPPPAQQVNNPPITLDGYCPVTLIESQDKWTKGDPRYGAIHRGRTYLFVGPEEQQRFLGNPDYYSPVLSAYDPVRFAESGQMVDGNRKHGVFYNQQVYLFTDEASLERFWASPQRYADIVRQAMNAAGNGPQRR
ncbi:MAG: thioredoxin domain-containing protein [Pirellulaceae bacterium]